MQPQRLLQGVLLELLTAPEREQLSDLLLELLGQQVTNIIPEGFAERLVAGLRVLHGLLDALLDQAGGCVGRRAVDDQDLLRAGFEAEAEDQHLLLARRQRLIARDECPSSRKLRPALTVTFDRDAR